MSPIDTLWIVAEFVYCPEEECTFEAWFRRYEELLEKNAVRLDDAARTKLLLSKLSTRYISEMSLTFFLEAPKMLLLPKL